jgi:uncharacterized protein involved in outer membrane biogenesis
MVHRQLGVLSFGCEPEYQRATTITMTLSRPIRIISIILIALLALIAAVIIFIVTFDWNRARPFINDRVSQATGRTFAIRGDLKVAFARGLDTEPGWRRYVPRPRISAADVHMSNPDWSGVGPDMVSAGRIVVALHPLALLSKRAVLTDVELQAPDVALERRSDGSNTWTFKQDDGGDTPSAWSVDVQRLAVADGRLRYLDQTIALDLKAKVASTAGETDLKAAPASQNTRPRFGLRFELGGTYRKAPIKGSGQAGALLQLENANTVYPVQASADLGKNHISVDGTLTDPRSLSGIDLALALGGDSMANLYPLTGVLLPETPAYATRGRLLGKKNGDNWDWTYRDFTGTVGGSDLSGTLEYLTRAPRPLLRGALTSRQLRLEDLGPTIGADSNESKKAREKAPVQPDDKALPVEQFNPEQWGALDADVKFTGKKLVRTHDIPLQDIVAEIHMKDRVLTLTPLNFGMAEGNITSNISLDGRQRQIEAQIRMAARHLKIKALFPKVQSMQASFGEVNGDAALSGRGNSVAAMIGSANGEISAVVTEGSVSEFILEAAGLNIANAVFVKLFGDKQVHMNCLASDFQVTNGRADVRRFVLDTDDALIEVSGHVDAAQEKLDLDIRPRTKGPRVISLRTPLYVKGTFSDPDVGPYKGPLALKAGAAIALAAINPLAAVLPLVNVSRAPDANCGAAIAESEKTRAAPKAPATRAPAKPVTEADVKRAQQKK